jgi:hypothetical protein
MHAKHNEKLMVKVLIIGAVIALLSYLFHPGVEQFTLSLNGEPVADPLVRFAALPSFLVILCLTGLLMVMLFLGIGVMVFIISLVVALAVSAILLPYFWPMLVVIFLIIAFMSVGHDKNI